MSQRLLLTQDLFRVRCIIVAALVLLAAGPVLAESHIYVDQATGVNTAGTTGAEGDPFASISYCVRRLDDVGATSPITVHVKAGVYDGDPAKDFINREIFPIELRDDLTLQGDDGAENCILSGAFHEDSPAAMILGEDATGFVLQDMTFQNADRASGNGGACELVNCLGIIRQCIFKDNAIDEEGAGVSLSLPPAGEFLFEDSRFEGNVTDEDAAAIYVSGDYRGNLVGCDFVDNAGVGFWVDDDMQGNVEECNFNGNANGITIEGYYTGDFLRNLFENNSRGGHPEGGAIYVTFEITGNIEENVFRGNTAFGAGGGFFTNQFTGNVIGNVFTGNQANSSGGGFYVLQSFEGAVAGNSFHENVAGSYHYGGAFYMNYVSCDIDANTFLENSSGDASGRGGGAIYIAHCSQATITRNTFAWNTSTGPGGAIYAYDYFSGIVSQNLFCANAGDVDGGALHLSLESTDSVAFSNNIFVYNDVVTEGSGLAVYLDGAATFLNNTFLGEGKDAVPESFVHLADGAQESVLTNNIFSDQGTAISMAGAWDLEIENNSF